MRLGLIDLTVFGSAKNCLLFGETALFYRNDWFGKRAGRGSISYRAFRLREIKSAGWDEVSLGRGESINISGASISKKTLIALLQDVQSVVG